MNEAGTPRLAATRFILAVYLLGVFLPLAASGQSPTAKTASPESPGKTASPAPTIAPAAQATPPLTDIATGADELQRLVQEMKRLLADDSERVTIHAALESLAADMESRTRQTDEVLRSSPSLPELQDLDSEWTSLDGKLNGIQRTLAAGADILNGHIAWLKLQQNKWNQILVQIQPDPTLAVLQSTVRQSLDEIQSTRTLAEEQLRLTVTLQSRAAERSQFVTDMLAKIESEKALVQRGLFEPDSSPLWNFAARRKTDAGLQRVLRTPYTRDWRRLGEFAAVNRAGLVFALLVFLLTLAGALKMRHRLRYWAETDIGKLRFFHIFGKPYSVAVFAGLLAVLPLLIRGPTAARGLLGLLLVVPVIRLLGPALRPVSRQLLFTVVVSNLLVQVVKSAAVSVSLKRDLLAMLALGIGLVAAWFLRRLRLETTGRNVQRSLAMFAAHAAVLLLFAAFAANLLGYFALSQLLTDALLLGSYYAVMLYTAREVITIILSTMLRTETANRLAVVSGHRGTIETWSTVLLTLGMWFAWMSSILNLLTIRDNLVAALNSALSRPLGSGEASFTGSDVISFIVVLALGIIFASALRVVLREEVLNRLPVRQGVPFALSTITYYAMLLAVFLLALVAGGVQLSKFTLFTGAFGIGVGFGLQNTINNFASGLVLLLERPIRQSDILEVEGVFGEVTRIGMRSTSIRTSAEAEVIVPNSTLVTGKVINWSRLGRRRPVEIPVKVVYGTNPQAVIDLLVKTASTHDDVLKDPAPSAFLQRFGDRALEFVLVFWVGRYHLHRKVLSEVAIRVTDAFREAGVQVPMPEAVSPSHDQRPHKE